MKMRLLAKNHLFPSGKFFACTLAGGVIPAKAGIQFLLTNTFIQVIPGWVILFYQFQFPCSFPFLYLFFSFERRFPRFMDFVSNQAMNMIFMSETLNQFVFVFINTLNKVGCHACIQSTIPLAAKNVNVKVLQMLSLDSRLRGNDEIIKLLWKKTSCF